MEPGIVAAVLRDYHAHASYVEVSVLPVADELPARALARTARELVRLVRLAQAVRE